MKDTKISQRKFKLPWQTAPRTSSELHDIMVAKYYPARFANIDPLNELRDIRKLLKRCKPEPYVMDDYYLRYIEGLDQCRYYLASGKYALAYDRLVTLLRFEPALQERILNAILTLLDEYVR